MKELDDFYEKIEAGDYDAGSESELNLAYQEIISKIGNGGADSLARKVNSEREALAFVKNPEMGLQSKMSGTGTNEKGEEIPFEWPDHKDFGDLEYEYIRERFSTVNNIYIKSELGLFLYYSRKLNHKEVKELILSLVSLCKRYLDKSIIQEGRNFYALRLFEPLRHAFKIASRRKTDSEIDYLFTELKEFAYETHLQWEIEKQGTLRIILDITDLIKTYIKEFLGEFDLAKTLDKNWIAAQYVSQTHTWGSIYIADASADLNKYIKEYTLHDWKVYVAMQYEKLSEEALAVSNDMVAVSFVEKALRLYEQLGKKEQVERLQLQYQRLRSVPELAEVKQELPTEESRNIYENIRKFVEESTAEEIVQTICLTPMIRPVKEVRNWSESIFAEKGLSTLLPVSIKDKFGNTIEKFVTIGEREEFSLLQTYDFHFQIASQALIQLIIEAIKDGKLSYVTVMDYFEQTWLNHKTLRRFNGKEVPINHSALIKSGIKVLFEEVEKWLSDKEYQPDFICATDSLTLKVEYVLRQICEKLDISTFKPRKEPGLVMEKLLDDLIKDLEPYLEEDDSFLIKYVLTSKAGKNLRNRVAHGLMDNIDYGVDNPFIVLVLLLKLSSYEFVPFEK